MGTVQLPTPPAAYQFEGFLFDAIRESGRTHWMLLIMGNLLALLPLGAGILLLWLPYQLYLLFGAPFAWGTAVVWSRWVSVAVGLLLLLLSMPLHELLHGLALWRLGHGVSFGIERGYLYAGIPDADYLTRRSYLLMSLTPLVGMTLGGGLLLLFVPPALGQLLLIILLINCAASVGDLFVARQVSRWPPGAKFGPSKQGIAVFMPSEAPKEPNNAI